MYREIEVLKTVNHPYIVKLYQVRKRHLCLILDCEVDEMGSLKGLLDLKSQT